MAWNPIEVKLNDLEHVYKVLIKEAFEEYSFDHWYVITKWVSSK
jgi:hypothetical protein